MKGSLILATLVVATFAGFQFLGTSPAPADEPQVRVSEGETPEFTTLFCKEEPSVREVFEAFKNEGDSTAFKVADKLLASGACIFETHIRYWQSQDVPEKYQAFKEAKCEQFPNGYCVAVQPAYYWDEKDVQIPGYFLVSQKVERDLPKVEATRLEKGLILDMN